MTKTTEKKLREFRKKFGHYRGLRPDGLNQWEIESFIESAIKEAYQQGVEDERERLTKNTLDKHNPDYLPSWYEKELDKDTKKETKDD